MPPRLVFEEEADLKECAVKISILIPDFFKSSFNHPALVDFTTSLCAGQIVLTPPPTPKGSPGVSENMHVIKKGRSTRKKGDFGDYIGRGKEKNKVISRPGQPKKK